MKNLLTACLPALALFALGGCAGTSALTSSEDDGVYYSSKDRTTAVVRAVPAPANASEEANPDYNGGASSSSARQNGSPTQYYDNNYTYMRGVPGYGGTAAYYGAGLNGYAPYSPYTSLGYAPFGNVCTGFGYGWGGGACGYSPYAYGGYDAFYGNPYGYGYAPYGYGSGINISFGFGQPYFGGFGYSPYGYGYSPYHYGGPAYGGYYGRGGYYGNNYGGYYGNSYGGYYGNNNGGYYNGNNGDNRGNRRTYGPRTDGASEGRYSNAPAASTGGGTPTGGGRMRSERAMGGEQVVGSGGQQLEVASEAMKRNRRDEAAPAGGYNNQPQRIDETVRPRYRNMDAPVATDGNNGRTSADVLQPQGQPAAAPEGRRRGGFFQNALGEPANAGAGNGQVAEQPRQRREEQPRQRTYEQPQQRTYEQPRQQNYEQPQRSYSQPSPSYGGGNNGGNNGGSGGGRGRD